MLVLDEKHKIQRNNQSQKKSNKNRHTDASANKSICTIASSESRLVAKKNVLKISITSTLLKIKIIAFGDSVHSTNENRHKIKLWWLTNGMHLPLRECWRLPRKKYPRNKVKAKTQWKSAERKCWAFFSHLILRKKKCEKKPSFMSSDSGVFLFQGTYALHEFLGFLEF